MTLAEELRASDQFIQRAGAELRHDFSSFLRDAVEVVDDHLRGAFEFGAEFGIGGGDANGAIVEVALANIHTAHRDHRGGAEVELLCSENGGNDHIATVADATIGA